MNAAAEVQQEDGDKVNHGWSQLDIAKHSTNTFVTSLDDDDYVRPGIAAQSPCTVLAHAARSVRTLLRPHAQPRPRSFRLAPRARGPTPRRRSA